MRIKKMVQRLAVATALFVMPTAGMVAVSATPAQAYATQCKTLYLSGDWWAAGANPWMQVPICYNGSSVWQSGNVTAGVNSWGSYINGVTWYGTYGGGNWLGAGINFNGHAWANFASFYCASRWGINAHGQQISYVRGC